MNQNEKMQFLTSPSDMMILNFPLVLNAPLVMERKGRSLIMPCWPLYLPVLTSTRLLQQKAIGQ